MSGAQSIPPEQLLRALLLQVLYTVRSERLLMEELNDNLLFRWFVGLNMDDPVWHPTTFTKNRDRLLSGDVAARGDVASEGHRQGSLAGVSRPRAAGQSTGACRQRLRDPRDGDRAERDAAVLLLEASASPGSTVGADKGYDVARFVADVRVQDVTPHVAQKVRGSAIDGRTTRHAGYHVSQRKRKLVEQVFGWMKTVGGLRKLRHRGIALVDWQLTFAATAYNLVRLRNLEARCP